jgi:hypothetical protein
MRKIILIGVLLGSLLQLSPIRVNTYQIADGIWQPIQFRPDVELVKPVTRADLDGNGIPEVISLDNGIARLKTNGMTVWESPPGWQVKQALISDLDQDDKPELTLLIQRPYQPWPVDQWLPYGGRIADFQDPSGMSSHIILIGWKDGRYKEVWAGSSLSQPALVIAAADLNQDGRTELVTMEGTYNTKKIFPGKAIKLWEWNGFGFSLLSSLPGEFNNFMIFKSRSEFNAPSIIAY